MGDGRNNDGNGTGGNDGNSGGTSQAPGNAGHSSAPSDRTFTQADLDRVVTERLSREREKYADYDDLKNKAARFDEHQAAQQTDLERIQGQYEELLGKHSKAEHDLRIQRAISKHQLSPEDAEFLSGETDEEVDARAAKLAARTNPAGNDSGGGTNNQGDGHQGRRPDPSQGRGSSGDGASSVAAGRERFRSRYGKNTN